MSKTVQHYSLVTEKYMIGVKYPRIDLKLKNNNDSPNKILCEKPEDFDQTLINILPLGLSLTTVFDLCRLNNWVGVFKYLVNDLKFDVQKYRSGTLRAAVDKGQFEIVKILVEAGDDIHAHEELALKVASEKGNLKLVKYLVDQGADIHARSNQAVKEAAYGNHLSVVKYLISKGADWTACSFTSKTGTMTVTVKYLTSLFNEKNSCRAVLAR